MLNQEPLLQVRELSVCLDTAAIFVPRDNAATSVLSEVLFRILHRDGTVITVLRTNGADNFHLLVGVNPENADTEIGGAVGEHERVCSRSRQIQLTNRLHVPLYSRVYERVPERSVHLVSERRHGAADNLLIIHVTLEIHPAGCMTFIRHKNLLLGFDELIGETSQYLHSLRIVCNHQTLYELIAGTRTMFNVVLLIRHVQELEVRLNVRVKRRLQAVQIRNEVVVIHILRIVVNRYELSCVGALALATVDIVLLLFRSHVPSLEIDALEQVVRNPLRDIGTSNALSHNLIGPRPALEHATIAGPRREEVLVRLNVRERLAKILTSQEAPAITILVSVLLVLERQFLHKNTERTNRINRDTRRLIGREPRIRLRDFLRSRRLTTTHDSRTVIGYEIPNVVVREIAQVIRYESDIVLLQLAVGYGMTASTPVVINDNVGLQLTGLFIPDSGTARVTVRREVIAGDNITIVTFIIYRDKLGVNTRTNLVNLVVEIGESRITFYLYVQQLFTVAGDRPCPTFGS